MARGRSRARTQRAQRIIAVILLLSMALSGMAIYAAATVRAPVQQPTQQGR